MIHRSRLFSLVVGAALSACVADIDAGDPTEVPQALAPAVYSFATGTTSGKCIDVSGASTQDGANVQQWTCNGTPAQSFKVESLGGDNVRLVNTSSGKCVDVAGNGTADGTNIHQWTCLGNGAQTFRVEDLGGGQVRLVNPQSGKCADVAAAGTNDGANLQLWTCNGTKAQTFVPKTAGTPPPPPPPPPPTGCKRGIAANVSPGAAFKPKVGWWYNWSAEPWVPSPALEFVSMFWDERDVNRNVWSGAKFLLGFNEPNFKVQANLTPAEAASYWPALTARAKAAGVPIVSPAMNFCGPAGDCNGTSPYQWLKEFFAACPGCQVDYVAVHWYNCDVASLKDYLEPGGGLEGFEQFGKPIWLTEFACAYGGDTSPAGQEAYLRAAVPYLESNPHVFRYAWFSADPIPAAKLVNNDGSPTALGSVYAGLAGGCN
jgi:hypothetical protein